MGNSKVIFGNETLIDLTGDTVTPDTLLAGTTAHNRSGEQIVGTATVPEELDDLTDVTLTSPAEGDLLQYDATEQKWVNSAVIPQKVAGLQKTGCVNVAPNKATSQVISGVTFTANTNGSVGMVGTNSGGNINYLLSELTPVAGEYALVKNPTPNCYLVAQALRNGSHIKNIITLAGDETKVTAVIDYEGYDTVRLVARIQSGLAVDTTITYMFTPDLSATYDDYLPYSMTNRELTEAVTTVTQGIISGTTAGSVSSESNILKQGNIKALTLYFSPLTNLNANTWNTIATLSEEYRPANQIRMIGYSLDTDKVYAMIIGSNGNIELRGKTSIPVGTPIMASASYI